MAGRPDRTKTIHKIVENGYFQTEPQKQPASKERCGVPISIEFCSVNKPIIIGVASKNDLEGTCCRAFIEWEFASDDIPEIIRIDNVIFCYEVLGQAFENPRSYSIVGLSIDRPISDYKEATTLWSFIDSGTPLGTVPRETEPGSNRSFDLGPPRKNQAFSDYLGKQSAIGRLAIGIKLDNEIRDDLNHFISIAPQQYKAKPPPNLQINYKP